MDEYFIKEALKEAKKSLLSDDIPVGAIIVEDNKIIARAHNRKEKNKVATHHAEILAINKACKKKKSWYLNKCTLYITMEPCLMCCGAILQSRISKIVFCTQNIKFGYAGSIENILQSRYNNHYVDIEKGIMKEEAEKMLKDFFKNKR